MEPCCGCCARSLLGFATHDEELLPQTRNQICRFARKAKLSSQGAGCADASNGRNLRCVGLAGRTTDPNLARSTQRAHVRRCRERSKSVDIEMVSAACPRVIATPDAAVCIATTSFRITVSTEKRLNRGASLDRRKEVASGNS
jgi:hypothetical protein